MDWFKEMPGHVWRLIREERKSPYFWTLLKLELKQPFRVNWQNRWRWQLLRLVPWQIKYWSVVELATKGEMGNPGEVTALTMMKRAAGDADGY